MSLKRLSSRGKDRRKKESDDRHDGNRGTKKGLVKKEEVSSRKRSRG